MKNKESQDLYKQKEIQNNNLYEEFKFYAKTEFGIEIIENQKSKFTFEKLFGNFLYDRKQN